MPETPELLASPQDLATLTGRPISDPRLALALRRASGAFVGAVGWPVLQVVDERIRLRGDGSTELLLPARPVSSATVAVAGTTEAAVDDLDAPVQLDGRLGILTRPAGWPCGPVIVTWTYGYKPDEIPQDIADVVLERAAHVAESLGIYASIGTGPLSETFSAAAQGGTTELWAATVARYMFGVGDRS